MKRTKMIFDRVTYSCIADKLANPTWEVNDMHAAGKVSMMVPSDTMTPSNRQLADAFGYRGKVTIDDQTTCIVVSRASDGKPLGDLRPDVTTPIAVNDRVGSLAL